MKVGCMGFLALLLLLAVVLVGGAAALFFGGAMFDTPPIRKADYSTGNRYLAHEKMYELVLRDSGRSSRREPVVITDRELGAFLAGYLKESEGMPVSPMGVKLLPDIVEVQGQTAFRHLFKGFPSHFLPDYLPRSTMDRPVWVTVRGTIRLGREKGKTSYKYAQLDVEEFSLGNQDMGAWLLWLLLGQERLRWQVPGVVETIKIQDGRIVITVAR